MSKIIGVCGGSCSGKTTFAQQIKEHFGESQCEILLQDHYYIDQSNKFDHDGGAVNFDHPSAIDFDLLASHLEMLKGNQPIQVPIYDFATHSRQVQTVLFEPKPLVILDGILILSQPNITRVLDQSFFISCDTEMRLERRLKRDVAERGRTPDGVRNQFEAQVEPMHQEFVEPSKEMAHIVLTQEEYINSSTSIIKRIEI